jgi:hypothetical protein
MDRPCVRFTRAATLLPLCVFSLFVMSLMANAHATHPSAQQPGLRVARVNSPRQTSPNRDLLGHDTPQPGRASMAHALKSSHFRIPPSRFGV